MYVVYLFCESKTKKKNVGVFVLNLILNDVAYFASLLFFWVTSQETRN